MDRERSITLKILTGIVFAGSCFAQAQTPFQNQGVSDTGTVHSVNVLDIEGRPYIPGIISLRFKPGMPETDIKSFANAFGLRPAVVERHIDSADFTNSWSAYQFEVPKGSEQPLVELFRSNKSIVSAGYVPFVVADIDTQPKANLRPCKYLRQFESETGFARMPLCICEAKVRSPRCHSPSDYSK